eukprot:gene12905-7417_t
MFQNLYEKIKNYLIQFSKEHPYITFQITSFVVASLAMKAYRAYSKIRSKNSVIEIDFTNITILTKPQDFFEQLL